MSIEVMKQAMQALKKCHYYMIDASLPNHSLLREAFEACEALRQAITKAESYRAAYPDNFIQPLTDEEVRQCFLATNTAEPLSEGWPGLERFARAIEAAHGIGAK